jgi:predicted PurR-regulated permease PerM
MDRTRYVIRNYIVGLFIEMVAVAVAYCGALFILGVKYALLLGIIGALLNLIPYLGICIACVLTALITFSTNTPSTVVWSVVSIVMIHLIDANVLLPKIVGSKVKINALATIMGVIVGSAIWGIPGMFLAVPVMAIAKVAFEDIPALYPFAILMDDDGEIATNQRPMIRKLVKKVKIIRTKASV